MAGTAEGSVDSLSIKPSADPFGDGMTMGLIASRAI